MADMQLPEQASLLMVQNMMTLAKQLKLPVSYKVHERRTAADGAAAAAGSNERRTFSVVVHVHGDYAFKKYLQHCTPSDLLLYRGLLLQVEASPSLDTIYGARVQQAFLPKFENEGQDAAIADAVVEAAAAGRPMVITIKHSGSLVTLSADGGWAAKNSIANDFTAGGAALLRAHYLRLEGGDAGRADARLAALHEALRARRLSASFEMVTGCHGHHGQLPAGEYLVATSAHGLDPATHAPAFLGWLPFLELCVELGLPLNDTWIVAGRSMAAAARQLLDDLALAGGPTATAVRALGGLVTDGEADGCLHLPGTYPHEQWQGSRIEGFVVARGQPLDEQATARLRVLRQAMASTVLPLGQVQDQLRRPYQAALRQAPQPGGAAAAGRAGSGDAAALPARGDAAAGAWIQAKAAEWMPPAAVPHMALAADAREALVEALLGQPVVPKGSFALELAAGDGGGPPRRLYSRQALARAGAAGLLKLLEEEAAAAEAAAAAGGDGGGGVSRRAAELRSCAAQAAMVDDPVSDDLLVG